MQILCFECYPFSVYSITRSGVISMTEDFDLAAEIEKASDSIKEIFQKQTLEIPDNAITTIEQNTKISKLRVVQIFHDGIYKNYFGFSKVDKISYEVFKFSTTRRCVLSNFLPVRVQ